MGCALEYQVHDNIQATTTTDNDKDLKTRQGGTKEERSTIYRRTRPRKEHTRGLPQECDSNSKTRTKHNFTKLEHHKQMKEERKEQT